MRFRGSALVVPLGVLFSWIACSATPGGVSSSSGDGGSGGGSSGSGVGGCPRCDGDVFVPCGGDPVACAPKICSPSSGCVSCMPGASACDGQSIVLCADDGQSQGPVKTCDAAAGEVCMNGACVGACAFAEGSPSNVGCEFWVVDLDNEYSAFNDAAGNPFGVVLSNAGEVPAQVIIERNDAPPGAPLQTAVVDQRTIEPGMLAEIELPVREVDGSTQGKDEGPGTFLSSNAYRVRSTAPLVAYQLNTLKSSYSNDASLLLPSNGLGTAYRVLGWPTANPIAFGPVIAGIPDHSFVTIVGVEVGTEVTVTLGGPIVGGSGIPASGAGAVIKQALGPFDVLNLESDKIPGDLTNTRVVSSRPVAVFSGGERGSAPYGVKPPPPPSKQDNDTCCTDHLEEQMFPLAALGTKFVASRSPIRSTGGYIEADIIRFLAVEPQTVVTTSLPAPDSSFTLGDGEMREVAVTTDFVAMSSAPLVISQILVSQAWTEAPIAGGDPSLTIFPPIEQFRDRYQFLVPGSWDRNYVVVSHEAGTGFQIDGQNPACVEASAGMIDGKAYSVARCELTEGVHRVQADAPVGIIVYGYGNVGSYAFAGGADVKKIYEPPK